MLSKWQFNILAGLGALALLLAVSNGWLLTQGHNRQAALSEGRQFVQQGAAHETLYREIVKALAELGVKSNDAQVLNLLAAQGLSVSVNSPAAGAAGRPGATGSTGSTGSTGAAGAADVPARKGVK